MATTCDIDTYLFPCSFFGQRKEIHVSGLIVAWAERDRGNTFIVNDVEDVGVEVTFKPGWILRFGRWVDQHFVGRLVTFCELGPLLPGV